MFSRRSLNDFIHEIASLGNILSDHSTHNDQPSRKIKYQLLFKRSAEFEFFLTHLNFDRNLLNSITFEFHNFSQLTITRIVMKVFSQIKRFEFYQKIFFLCDSQSFRVWIH